MQRKLQMSRMKKLRNYEQQLVLYSIDNIVLYRWDFYRFIGFLAEKVKSKAAGIVIAFPSTACLSFSFLVGRFQQIQWQKLFRQLLSLWK